jgi:hypothetical protein
VKAAGAVISQLNTFSGGAPELGKNLAIILEHLDSRDHAAEKDPRSPGGQGYTGLEALLEYVYDQVMSVNVYDANVHVLKVSLQGGGDCADYAGIKEAKEFGKECAAALGPMLAGLTDPDSTRPPGATDDEAATRRRNRRVDGDPSTQVAAPAPAAPAAPTDVSGGAAPNLPAVPAPAPAPPPSGGGPLDIPKILPGQSHGPSLPKIGGGLSAKPASDQRTRVALLDYLLGN